MKYVSQTTAVWLSTTFRWALVWVALRISLVLEDILLNIIPTAIHVPLLLLSSVGLVGVGIIFVIGGFIAMTVNGGSSGPSASTYHRPSGRRRRRRRRP